MMKRLNNDRGSILLIVMALLMMTTFIGLSMYTISDDDLSIANNVQNTTKAFYSSESGISMARSVLWSQYVASSSTNPPKNAGDIGNRASYQSYLDGMGLSDSTSLVLFQDVDLGDGQAVEQVTATRTDIVGATTVTVSSVGAAMDGSQNTISARYQIEGEAFKGFEFAILANNVNCIMCHATIDNVERVYNTDASKEGTFDRVKIAALESMLIRTGKADSRIAGTIYSRGTVTDKAGNIITDVSPNGGGLEGFGISGLDGKIEEPMTNVQLTEAVGSPPPQFGNFYLNYPTDEANMTDGVLPESFPPPFPDANGNRYVDDAEFDEIRNQAMGSITGGIMYGVKSTQSYTSGTLPGAGNETSILQGYEGNLILIGTDANPIDISGDIAVDGDVIIQGKVKGLGQIYARGNVYITGDMTYADGEVSGNRTFGVAADGSQNALSIASGQNIMIGDYLTLKSADISDPNSAIDPGNLSNGEKFSFAQSEMTLFNRMEWTKTQEFLPGSGGGMINNANYIPGYKPRYYVMNKNDPVYIFNKDSTDNKGKSKGTYWDPASGSWLGKEHASSYDMNLLTQVSTVDAEAAGATVVTLSSTSNWISPSVLKSVWANNNNARTSGDPFKIDGQLYTNNSIFALARKRSNNGGQMTINGALIAADVGVLVGVKLNLHYDQRLKNFLNIKDDSKIVLSQTAWFSG